MLGSFVAFFSREFSYEKVEQKETNNKVTNLLSYRDAHLIENKKPKKRDLDDGGKLERRSHESSTCTAIVEKKSGSGIRVKIRMTKAEAARLLSKCKDGGVLGFKDVENELAQIPMNRVHLMPPTTTTTYTHAAVLKTIPEES